MAVHAGTHCGRKNVVVTADMIPAVGHIGQPLEQVCHEWVACCCRHECIRQAHVWGLRKHQPLTTQQGLHAGYGHLWQSKAGEMREMGEVGAMGRDMWQMRSMAYAMTIPSCSYQVKICVDASKSVEDCVACSIPSLRRVRIGVKCGE